MNPVVTPLGDERESADEGCLSLQEVLVPVERPTRVVDRGDRPRRRSGADGARGARRARRAARGRPPRRHPDHRPDDRRGAARGARDAPAQAGARRPRLGRGAHRRRGDCAVRRGRPRAAGRRHEIAFVLTRPDSRRGRGRAVAPPPRRLVAERLGMPVLQPERLDAAVELPAETIVAVAYGLLVPAALLERHLWLNVHPSLLPRWRGAAPVERAIMAGDDETGVTIIRLVEELDAGPIGAQEAFAIGPDDDAGRRLRARRRGCGAAPRPAARAVRAAGRRGHDVRREDRGRPIGSSISIARRTELVRRVRALSPHIGARAELERHGQSPSGARGSRPTARSSRSRCSRRAGGAWTTPPGSAACADGGLARTAGRVRGRPARVRAGRLRRSSARDSGGGTRRPRPGARPADRLRHRAARARARPRRRGARPPPGREARPAGPRGAAHRRLPARVPLRRRAARGRQRDGGARPRRGTRAGGPVHERGDAAAHGRPPRAARRPAGGAAQALVSRTGSRRSGSATSAATRRWHSCARRTSRPRPSSGSSAARSTASPPTLPAPTVSNGWTSRRWPRAESGRRAADRSSPRSPSARCRASGRSTCAPPRAARRHSWRGRCGGREARRTGTRAGRERGALGATNVRSSTPTRSRCRDELRDFDRALVDAPCSGLGVLNSRPDLRWRAEPLPDLQLALLRAAAERVKPGGTVVYSVCTLNADENEAVVDASGLADGRPRRRLACVPAPDATGVPAHAAARPPHVGLLRRPP